MNVIRWLAVASMLAVFVDTVYIFALYDYSEGGLQFDLRYVWLENIAFLKDDGISLHLAIDGIAAPLVLLNGIVAFAGALISLKIDYRNKDFFILFMALVTGVFGVYISMDLFFWFFFYELAVLPMYLLIVIWGSTNKEYGAMKLVMVLVGGSVLIFIGIFAVFVESGTGTFDLPVLREVEFDSGFAKDLLPLLHDRLRRAGWLVALPYLVARRPCGRAHRRLDAARGRVDETGRLRDRAPGEPNCCRRAPTSGCRRWWCWGRSRRSMARSPPSIRPNLKFVIGYSSVSHMGFVLMGLGTMNTVGLNGAVLQMFSHGVMTALFFAMVGALYDQAHTRDITAFGGIIRKMPLFVIFFGIAGLASLGLPGLSGFVAEFHIFVGAFDTFPLFAAIGVLSAAVTAVYILRLLGRAALGPLNMRWDHLREMQPAEVLAGLTLIVPIVAMGVWPRPLRRSHRERGQQVGRGRADRRRPRRPRGDHWLRWISNTR